MSDDNPVGRGVEYLRLVIHYYIRVINPNRYRKRVFHFNLYPITDEYRLGAVDSQNNDDVDILRTRSESYFFCLGCNQTLASFSGRDSILEVIDHLIDHQINGEIYFPRSQGYMMSVKDLVLIRFEDASYSVGYFFHYFITKLGEMYKQEGSHQQS